MKKNFIYLFLCLLAFAGCSSKQQSLPRFVVISDTHFGSNRGDGAMSKVPKALKNLFSKEPLPDAVFVVGDLTDRGKPEEYDQLISVFSDKTNVPEGVDIYFIGGFNHDHDRSANDYSTYSAKVKQPLHQYIEIKGYPFITISEAVLKLDYSADLNVEALRFLSEKLADAAQKYPGKPIFVFMHVPPLNTCYGSTVSDGWGTKFFLPVLNQYPQVIVFSGHSHWPIGDPRSIHQGIFTAVNDGSLTYSEIETGTVDIGDHPEAYENITEGLIVNVLSNKNIEIERWDTYRNEEIQPKWLVEAPHDGNHFTYNNRNGLPAPVFASEAKPVVTTVTSDSIVVTFPQATDNEVVHHYVVVIHDGEQVISKFGKFSQFYLNSEMPSTLSVSFSGLPSAKPLTAQVTAIDSYNNASPPIISEPFQLGQ
ncbi:MAG: metallophosphoesterase [Tannerella sp.]|jgi:3',5'-cyclic AMP phosphodiesterase CpdA|nr:metallophosphoesterase [Tannerella sp.]